jgi:hypothetical protein
VRNGKEAVMRRIMQKIARKTIDEKVNIEIMENELDSMDWKLNSLVWDLYQCFDQATT